MKMEAQPIDNQWIIDFSKNETAGNESINAKAIGTDQVRKTSTDTSCKIAH